MKILIISLAGIGDTLFATPLIKELKKKFPKCKIDFFVMWPGSKSLLKNNSLINKVYQMDMIKEGAVNSLRFCLMLRKKGYDISISTFPQSKSVYRLVSRLIGAKMSLSHRYDNYNFFDSFLIKRSIHYDKNRHSSVNNLELLKLLNLREINLKKPQQVVLSGKERQNALRFLKKNKLEGKNLFGVSIGAGPKTGATKNLYLRRWPVDNYVGLINRLLGSDKSLVFLLFGGPGDEDQNLEIVNRCNSSRVISVKTETVLDAYALLEKCDSFLSVDNMLMHLAAAAKVPNQFVIRTPTINKTVTPYLNKFVLLGKPVPKSMGYNYDGRGIYGKKVEIENYMRGISPSEIFESIKKHFKGRPPEAGDDN